MSLFIDISETLREINKKKNILFNLVFNTVKINQHL